MLGKLLIAGLALAIAQPVQAAQDEETIELKDGTILIVQADGKMRHVDNRGHAVLMKED